MEMCYDGALVMPSSYVAMDEEEMTYVEGGGLGKHWYNKTSFVAFAIDALICVIPAISALNSLCKVGKLAKAGRVYIRTNINKALRSARIALATSVLSAITDIIMAAAGVSIGSIITWGIERIDGKRDGYCFA